MKKLNKFICLLMLLVLISGCSFSNIFGNNSTSTQNNVTNNITENTTVVGDITIEDMEKLSITAYEKVSKACVGITLKLIETSSGVVYEAPLSTGSGVIYKRIDNVNSKGEITNYTYYLFTNRHVVVDDVEGSVTAVDVYLGDEYPEYRATIVGYDTYVDMAVCKFDSPYFIDPVVLGDSNSIKRGSFAFAVGCPKGFDYFNTVTFGVISNQLVCFSEDTDGDGVNDTHLNYIQHDVAINPGNSGGGLFNLKGELIGLNTLKFATENIENMGFSVPVNILKTLAFDYIEKNIVPKRARLGISAIEVRKIDQIVKEQNNLKDIPNIYQDVKYGVYITEIEKKNTISTSNIEVHDIILEVNGEKLYNMISVITKLNSLVDYKVGDTIVITYWDRSLDKIVEEEVVLR